MMSRDDLDTITTEAAQWAVRLSDRPLSADARAELDRWLAENPAHGPALEQAQSMWRSLAELTLEQPSAHQSNHARHGSWLAMAACLLLSVALGWWWLGNPWLALTATAHTGPGEMLHLVLDDGSTMELAPESAASVRYDDQARRVELLAGKAYFAPRPQAQAGGRPFVVDAKGGSAQALGTRFVVDGGGSGDTVVVTVEEHTVLVTGPDGQQRVVLPGQRTTYGHGETAEARTTDIRQATAWRDGRLIFDRVALSRVVEELNRYRRVRIVLMSDDLAARPVSGVFDVTRLDDALDAIARETGASTARVPLVATLLY